VADRAQSNVEAVRRGVEAYNGGDVDVILEIFAPDVEIHAVPELINSGTYHGHDEFLTWLAGWEEAWEEFTIEVEAIDPVGDDHVVVEVLQRARGAGSGAAVEMRLVQLYEIREGVVTRFHLYMDRDQAVAAATRFSEDPHATP
jgi:ketosteroid isomerase-like protein